MNNKINLTPINPHLLRAFYDWMIENDKNPMISVNTNYPGAESCKEYAGDDGLVVFNISPQAVNNLSISDQWVEFDARFQGLAQSVMIPILSVMGIMAHDHSIGTMLPAVENDDPEPEPDPEKEGTRQPITKLKKKPTLRIVK